MGLVVSDLLDQYAARPSARGVGQSPARALVGPAVGGREGGRPPRLPSEFSPLARALEALGELHRRHNPAT